MSLRYEIDITKLEGLTIASASKDDNDNLALVFTNGTRICVWTPLGGVGVERDASEDIP